MRDALRTFSKRLWWLISKSDTTPTRFMLAMTASLWAMLLAFPGDTMSRPGFIYLASAVGDYAELKWTVLWSMCAGLLWWRLFSASRHRVISQLVNAFACMLFTTSCLAFFFARPYPVPAGVATDLACMLAAAWVLVRTHIHSGPGWRHD